MTRRLVITLFALLICFMCVDVMPKQSARELLKKFPDRKCINPVSSNWLYN